jgi:hypothetical protein
MRARSFRLLALAAGFVVLLSVTGVAHAGFSSTVVRAGSADAGARGTTAGIAVLDRVAGTYTDNGAKAHQRFGAASLVKLFIAERALHRAATGRIRLTLSDRVALARMLRSSDDAVASRFWSRLGGTAVVTDVAKRYGLRETRPPANPRYWGLTQVTAHDLVVFYNELLKGSGGLPARDRDFMVKHLRAATARGTDGVYQWFGLHDGLPREPVIGIKQGWMCCFSDGYIWRHSTGIVGRDSRYVVVVLTRDAARRGSAHTAASSTSAVRKMFPAGQIPRVQGAIGERWYAMGAHRSRLGLPTTEQLPLPGGAWQRFAAGSIYWTRSGGAHVVEPTGALQASWSARGREGGPLGYPISDAMCGLVRDGCAQVFQGGVLAASAGGTYWIPTALVSAWRAAGSEGGWLGYPTGDPRTGPEGTTVEFERGTLTATPAGAVVSGALPAAGAAAVPPAPERMPATTSAAAPTSTAAPEPPAGATETPATSGAPTTDPAPAASGTP